MRHFITGGAVSILVGYGDNQWYRFQVLLLVVEVLGMLFKSFLPGRCADPAANSSKTISGMPVRPAWGAQF